MTISLGSWRRSAPWSSVTISAALALGLALPARAVEPESVMAERVELVPASGVTSSVGEGRYTGTLAVTSYANGLALTESTDVDSYLLGIREVPFSWPGAALRSQAVAARTYLAWTLMRGRSAVGRRYAYDICATEACQVYAGVGGAEGVYGKAWRQAVESTGGQILVADGSPAQALYSSTSGGRTRSVEDVFVGSAPLPYLRAVPSPDESSPFVEWEFEIDGAVMEDLLGHAGRLDGVLLGVRTIITADGEGPWEVEVEATGGTQRVPTWVLRTDLNRAARALYPDLLPAIRPDGSGRRYPQTVMSPTYTIHDGLRFVPPSDGEPPTFETIYTVRGRGWGHLVGMSQYGAEAMARLGADHTDILAHYYGGLTPQPGSRFLPEPVVVGLATGLSEIEVRPDGPMAVVVDGEPVAPEVLGTWRMEVVPGGMVVTPPVGLGLPPRLERWRLHLDSAGRPELVEVASATAAEIRVVVTQGKRVLHDSGWEVREAGVLGWDWDVLIGRGRPDQPARVEVEARSPEGSARSALAVVPGLE